MSNLLSTDIKYLPGVGPKKAELLFNELGISNFEQLLYYFPYKYVDKSRFYAIRELNSNMQYIQLKGQITGFKTAGSRYKKRLVALFTDGTGTIELIWFKGHKWIMDSLQINTTYIVFGKPTIFQNRLNIAHPEIETPAKREESAGNTLIPLYNTTEKMKNNYLNSKALQKITDSLVKKVKDEIPETLPSYLIDKLKLLSLNEALMNIHFPKNSDILKRAIHRLKFEELFYIQLNLLKIVYARNEKIKGYIMDAPDSILLRFYNEKLPFKLTGAQIKVMNEIRTNLISGKQMNRLLQGDVGSGKTLVALLAMLIALDNGYQAAFMAPTEILANQHYTTLEKMLEGLDLNIGLLTGSSKKSERDKLHTALEDGSLNLLTGTHALIEDTVQFANLGMVIIDEQHRFGVAQRAKLWKKSKKPPHVLVMTATPIPRTLSMTVYGDLDVSVIDELPPGRKPVNTLHRNDSHRLEIFGFMKKQIGLGRQVYVVYPLIKESEKMDYKDLEDGYESITRAFPIPKYAVSIVHGKMKPDAKKYEMQRFKKGETQIMVSTTVIEVGVDVPNASVMVIESAERFGLSQLHQLRGRVGRGANQSYCILVTKNNLDDRARKRMEIMTATNDGFKIAEEDMLMRGPGDIEGTQQSGFAFDLKISNIARDGQILQNARNVATRILDHDPELKKPINSLLVKQLAKLSKSCINWSDIS